MPEWNDPDFLLARQYRNADNLRHRHELHRRFGRGGAPWFDWVFDFLPRVEGQQVLEVGAGPAALWTAVKDRVPGSWQLTLTDLSPGMVAEAREALAGSGLDVRFQTADAQELPFADGSFDVVIANHMLYHLPDLDRGLSEIRRVLRPGGRLLAATNGPGHMRELFALVAAAGAGDYLGARRPHLTFRLDNGADLLAEHFERVERFDQESELLVTEAEPLLAYIGSMIVPARADAAARVAAEVAARLDRDGAIRIGRHSGLFVAAPGGAGGGRPG